MIHRRYEFQQIKREREREDGFPDEISRLGLRTVERRPRIANVRDIFFESATIGMSTGTEWFRYFRRREGEKGESPPKTALVRVFSRDPIRGGLTNRGNLVTLRADDAGAPFIRFCSRFLEITRSKSRCLSKAIVQDIPFKSEKI